MPRGVRSISARKPSKTDRIVPSSSFSETLPVKPSVTTTSAAPSSSQRLSTLPAKFRSLAAMQRVRLLRRLVPLRRLLADGEQADLGPCDLEDLLREDRAHRRELEQMLRLRLRVRARVDQHRRPAHGRDDDSDRRPHHSRAAAVSRAATRPASRPCSPPRRRPPCPRGLPTCTRQRASCPASRGRPPPASRASRWPPSSRRARVPPGRSTKGRTAPAERRPSARRAHPRRSRPAHGRRRARRRPRGWEPCA